MHARPPTIRTPWLIHLARVFALIVLFNALVLATFLPRDVATGRGVGSMLVGAFALLVIASVGVLILLAVRRCRPEEFDLLKPAKALVPADFDFVPVADASVDTGMRRPQFKTYVPRRAVPYGSRPGWYELDEAAIAAELRAGRGVLLIGRPLEGKTRTVQRIVAELDDYLVLRPRSDRMPADIASMLLQKRPVLVLLDDVQAYGPPEVDLQKLFRLVAGATGRWAVLATSLDAPALHDWDTLGHPVRVVVDHCAHVLQLQRLAPAVLDQVAAVIGRAAPRDYATVGELCIGAVSPAMRQRFASLDPFVQDCWRAIRLVSVNGPRPATRRALEAAMSSVFGHPADADRFDAAMLELAHNGFIAPERWPDPAWAEPAYLFGSAASDFYGDRQPQADADRWVDSVIAADALPLANQLALAAWRRHDPGRAQSILARIIARFDPRTIDPDLRPDLEQAMTNAAWIAVRSTPLPAAVPDAPQDVADPAAAADDPAPAPTSSPARRIDDATTDTQVALARAILDLARQQRDAGEFDAAVALADTVVERIGDALGPPLHGWLAQALYTRGTTLGIAQRADEALATLDRLIARFGASLEPGLRELVASGMNQRVLILLRADRAAEALQCVDAALATLGGVTEPGLREELGWALHSKVMALLTLGRVEEARRVSREFRRQVDAAPQEDLERLARRCEELTEKPDEAA